MFEEEVLKIFAFNEKGFGVSKHKNAKVIAPLTLIDEEVLLSLTKKRKGIIYPEQN